MSWKIDIKTTILLLIESIIRQNMWFIYVQNYLVYKYNSEDVGNLMVFFEKHV